MVRTTAVRFTVFRTWEICSVLEQSWKQYNQEQQRNHFHLCNKNMVFVNRIILVWEWKNVNIDIQMKKRWWLLFVWMVDVIIQGCVWVLHCINEDKCDESQPLLAFWRHVVSVIYLKYLKGRQIILKPFRNSKYAIKYLLWWRKLLPGAFWTQGFSKPHQTRKGECF